MFLKIIVHKLWTKIVENKNEKELILSKKGWATANILKINSFSCFTWHYMHMKLDAVQQ